MFTAADMMKAVQQESNIPDLDEWIEFELKGLFLRRYSNFQVNIAVSSISRKGWDQANFYKGMVARGFGVSRTDDQRDGDFYTITLPQVENN